MTAWRNRPIPWLPGQYEIYNPKTFTVGDGVELTAFTNDITTTLDVSDSTITIGFPGERMVGFDKYSGSFAFKINTPDLFITSASIGPSTTRLFDLQLNSIALSADTVRWTSDTVFFDIPTMIAKQGAKIEIQVQTSAVPEPANSLLILIGIAGIACRTRSLTKAKAKPNQ